VDTKLVLEYTMISECVMAVACLVIMWRKRLLRDMWGLAAFLAVYAIEIFISIGLMYFRKEIGIAAHPAWVALYYTRWVSLLIEYGLLLTGIVAERLQQGTSVLLLCMLVFVCFATRYLGLTYRSRIFGILLGLGIFSACTLVESAWLATKGTQTVFAPVFLVSAFGFLACLVVWSGYLLAPEPERKLVLLPTTSPYFFWNQVSEALGDDPGHVVVSGFTPDMLAPGEIQMLKKTPASAQPSLQQQRPVKVASGI